MLYTIPDYYHEFSCIAGECEDTCCAGWQIVADEAALKNIKSNRIIQKRIRKSINWKEGTFKQDKNKRCAFLNEQNLCDMYTALGEKVFAEPVRCTRGMWKNLKMSGDDTVCILSGGGKDSAW